MKIILSRKGVDSSAGGFASPIFPDGRLLSIPIPDDRAPVKYRDIQGDDKQRILSKLVKDLGRGKLSASQKVHVDPDLDKTQLQRKPGWRPLFGQCGAAQSHLHSLAVGPGDLFLFFGWFREVEIYRRRWRYVSGAADKHVLFGWMQIASVDTVAEILQTKKDRWAHYHPHCVSEFSGSNVIYRGTRQLVLTDHQELTNHKTAGAGLFEHYHDKLCLTEIDRSRSHWRLPGWMHPQGRNSTLSYHSDPTRWCKDGDDVLLRSAARGQEFVLNLEDYPEGVGWVRGLFGER